MGSLAKYTNRSPNIEAFGIILTGNTRGADLTTAVATAYQTTALDGGSYDIWCDVSVYVKVATTANDVTTTSGYLLRANNTVGPVIIGDGEKIGAIGAVGTLSFHKVN